MSKVPNAGDALYPKSEQQQTPIVFTGKAGEYFGIWIVNLLLTILTLGIYSAWAKVRTKKYFYNHTLIADVGFDYHAKPLSILKGRLIAVVLYAVYFGLSKISQSFAIYMMLGLFGLTPYFIVRSTKFNYTNTSHRGLRFNFSGTDREANKIYLGWPLMIILTLGLIWPYINFRSNKFLIKNASYGNATFSSDLKPGAFYLLYLIVVGLILLLASVLFTIFAFATYADYFGLDTKIFYSLLFCLAVFGMVVPVACIRARISNMVYNTTTLGEFSFKSSFRTRDLAWIYVSNIIALILSLGLLFPWTKIRLARYYTSHLVVQGRLDFAHFVAGKTDKVSALNEGISDVFDIEAPGFA